MKDDSCSVLVVEDCEDLRELEVSYLESFGFKVASASNGQEALNILSSIPKPCIVLLDLMMPIMNGRQFLNTIKKIEEYSNIPVLIVSAIAEISDTSGAIGYLKKPINLDSLKTTIAQYCR